MYLRWNRQVILMSYKQLRKIKYQGDEAYQRAYESRFCSEDCIKLDFFVGKNQAFFLFNADVSRLALKICRLDKKIYQLAHQLPRIASKQYARKCLIDEIVLTNGIEGVHSSRKEIGEALQELAQQSAEKKKSPRFLSLVGKYNKLMTKEQIPMKTCEDIRAIYDELLLDEIMAEDPNHRPDGVLFRKEATHIYDGNRVLHSGLYPETKIIQALQQALYFLNDDHVEPLLRISLFHYLLEYIHPFYDGNGRLGRFILSYCISQNLEPLLAYRISTTIKDNLTQYYKAFEDCNDPANRGDLTPFLLMQLNMILKACQSLEQSLTEKLERFEYYTEHLRHVLPATETDFEFFQIASLLIQASLFSEDGIAKTYLLEHFSNYILNKKLSLIPKPLLCVKKKHKFNFYQFNLSVLDEMISNSAQT